MINIFTEVFNWLPLAHIIDEKVLVSGYSYVNSSVAIGFCM